MNRWLPLFLITLSVLLSGPVLADGNPSRKVEFSDSWGDPGFNLISQSKSGLEIVYSVPYVEFTEMSVDGKSYTNVSLPGAVLGKDAGLPNLPGVSRFFAFPQGATVTMDLLQSRSRTVKDLRILPAPPIPREDDDSPPVYIEDPAIYGSDDWFPNRPVLSSEPYSMRGVDVALLGITPFVYNPVKGELVIFTDIRIRVNFDGGDGVFGGSRLRSRWFEPMLKREIINFASLPALDAIQRPAGRGPGRDEECEYMIFIPNDPAFQTWAEVIRDFRVKQGISTNIFNIADLGGTANAIENKINSAYNNWTTPLAAVLLLGDTCDMPTRTWGGTCLSDNIYADVDGDDLPDVNVARITARSNSELSEMVGKFVDYETNPPTSGVFYNRPLFAGGWQTERWFILCTEVVYGFMANELGKNPRREYAIYSGSPGSEWSTNTNTHMIVDYFGPSGLGYIPATPAHLTDWSGNAAGVNSHINSGAFWVLHRDHGSETGWGEPDYSISDLYNLYTNDLPFVLSINCLTGKYDYNPESFAEAFHRLDHGALGLIAASNTSYSFVNDTFVFGIHDSMWPEFDPYNLTGSDEKVLMPGFANQFGKWYLESSSWPSNPGNKDITYHLFHMHGDAFTQIYSQVPQNLSVYHESLIDASATSFAVTVNNGSFIALTQDGEILGTADGTGGSVNVALNAPLSVGTMIVTITKPNYYRYEAQVVVDDTNYPPNLPSIDGPDEVIMGVLQPFTVETWDSDGDDVYFRFEWDEGPWSPSDWFGPYPENSPQVISHAWAMNSPAATTYEVHVQSMDDRNGNGIPDEGPEAESDWNSTHFWMVNRPPEATFTGETHQGYRNVEYTFTATGSDPDGHDIFFKIHWGDWESTDVMGPYPSGTTITMSHSYDEPGGVWPAVKVWDDHDCNGSHEGGTAVMSDTWYLNILNQTPAVPNLNAKVTAGPVYYAFAFGTSTSDPEGDDVFYQFDWGEKNHLLGQIQPNNWIGPYSTDPVQLAKVTHKWKTPGTYKVKVRAKDQYGAITGWSKAIEINVGISSGK